MEFVGSRITPGNLTWLLCVYSAVISVRFESAMLPCVAQLALSFTSVWMIDDLCVGPTVGSRDPQGSMRGVLGVHSEKQNNTEKIATVVCFGEASEFLLLLHC